MFEPAKIGQFGPRQRSTPLLRTTLGEVLRKLRREQRRTLADVAREAKVSMPYLSELERGRKEASSEVLAAICAALSIELSELLAQVGRELAADRAGAVPVIRLVRIGEATSGGLAGPAAAGGAAGPADPVCLLAA
ncbi:MAG TPA: helix-turn-helix transcriptional regulator [Streptosporangiaceae bacterium]|jgi:transcriptional regulator with XRE-family HTH domain